MPVHHVPRRDLHAYLEQFTRQNVERVMSVCPDPEDSQCFLVVTESFEIETRSA